MKIGIFGGSFDPIHKGHIGIANYLIEKEICSEIIFLPCGEHSPSNKNLSEEKHRYNMLELCIKKYPNFSVCDLELKKKEPRFTYQSLNILAQIYDIDKIAFIMGIDNLKTIHLWHNSINLVKNFDFYIFTRPDERKIQYSELIECFKGRLTQKLLNSIIEDSHFKYSSSEIKEKVKESMPIDKLVEKEVADYIKKNNLYKE